MSSNCGWVVLIFVGIFCTSLQSACAHSLAEPVKLALADKTEREGLVGTLIADKTTAKDDDQAPKSFSGNASWYGKPFDGRKTASGEVFDMNKLSAAHKTLPFPTKVMVENPKNGQSCVIRVIDRGPYARGRVLDLSREAAKRIGIFPGVGYVEATVLPSTSVTKDKK